MTTMCRIATGIGATSPCKATCGLATIPSPISRPTTDTGSIMTTTAGSGVIITPIHRPTYSPSATAINSSGPPSTPTAIPSIMLTTTSRSAASTSAWASAASPIHMNCCSGITSRMPCITVTLVTITTTITTGTFTPTTAVTTRTCGPTGPATACATMRLSASCAGRRTTAKERIWPASGSPDSKRGRAATALRSAIHE